MNFFPMKTIYTREGRQSKKYTDLLYPPVTLDVNFVKGRYRDDDRTPFKEVSVVPFDHKPFKALRKVKRTLNESKHGLFSRVKDVLKRTIIEHWRTDYSHVILHSSGYDSRVLSWLIREIYLDRGDEWLGNTVFVCSKWESGPFIEIMKHEGWDTRHYHVARSHRRDWEYYERELTDFANAWKWSDGASSIPVNLFWYLTIAAIEKGLVARPVQVFTGHNGNIMFMSHGPSDIESFMLESYSSIFGERPMFGDSIIHPYSTFELAKVLCESSERTGDLTRPEFVKWLDSGLYEFSNLHTDGDRHRRISDTIMDKVVSDYNASWYGKHIQPHPRPRYKTTEFQPFWYHWTMASLCEHLREQGHIIRCSRGH